MNLKKNKKIANSVNNERDKIKKNIATGQVE